MRIAVLGAPGQLGRDLVPLLNGEALPLSRADIDLTRPETIRPKLAELRPAVVVNCAAYNFVDKAEAEPEAAFATNAFGVRHLAIICREVGAKLVHVSTDYVFGLDATRRTPLSESDPPGPVSTYGASKLAGEYFALSVDPANLVVRTCGLYGVWGSGGKGGNFVETMLRVADQGKPLRVVNDQRCTPSYTADVAATVAALIRVGAAGLVHASNAGDCTWYEFAAEIFRQTGLGANLTPITSAEFGAAARRPSYSVLSQSRLAEFGVPITRPWADALAAYLSARSKKSGLAK
ncbi:MAG TPA: dTDP-4-dehydrorhamnose reductase [Fimbriiglobus sp.]|jgi:dTDP-4-dehydrorhamnose reductase